MQFARISRRAFFALLIASVIAALIGHLLRLRIEREIVRFFGLDPLLESKIAVRLNRLKTRPDIYRATVYFFTLAAIGANRILPRKWQARVLHYWSIWLFNQRSISWGYVYYPNVNDPPICNGLIRTQEKAG